MKLIQNKKYEPMQKKQNAKKEFTSVKMLKRSIGINHV